MAKITSAGASDKVTGEGMPVPVDGTSYDDTPGVNGPHRIVTATEVTEDTTTTRVVENGRVTDRESETPPPARKSTKSAK